MKHLIKNNLMTTIGAFLLLGLLTFAACSTNNEEEIGSQVRQNLSDETKFVNLSASRTISNRSEVLSEEEYKQMKALQTEAISLISDMASIIGRKTGQNLLPVGNFEITTDENGKEVSAKVTPIDDEITIGYYCDPPGVCQTEPCGSSSKGNQLTAGEYEKMQILKSNLFVKLNTMSRIIGKNLGQNLLPIGGFKISIGKDGEFNGTVTPLDDEITLGYYCDPPGVCQMDPCD